MPVETTPYAEMGGDAFFETLVHRFYQGVAADPLLRRMYPEDDLGPAERRLTMFLVQYWGGPSTYSEERGHPRLRLRHQPFAIDERARDAWLDRMREALDHAMVEHDLDPALEGELWRYLVGAALAMQNVETTDPNRSPGLTVHENPR